MVNPPLGRSGAAAGSPVSASPLALMAVLPAGAALPSRSPQLSASIQRALALLPPQKLKHVTAEQLRVLAREVDAAPSGLMSTPTSKGTVVASFTAARPFMVCFSFMLVHCTCLWQLDWCHVLVWHCFRRQHLVLLALPLLRVYAALALIRRLCAWHKQKQGVLLKMMISVLGGLKGSFVAKYVWRRWYVCVSIVCHVHAGTAESSWP